MQLRSGFENTALSITNKILMTLWKWNTSSTHCGQFIYPRNKLSSEPRLAKPGLWLLWGLHHCTHDGCEGADLMKHLDNSFESAREDRCVPVNNMAADFTVMFCKTLPAQGCAEMQVPVRSWETYRGEEFGFSLRIWEILGGAYPGKIGSTKIKIGPISWHLQCKGLKESF